MIGIRSLNTLLLFCFVTVEAVQVNMVSFGVFMAQPMLMLVFWLVTVWTCR
jgi:hypothetical protein